MDPSYERDIQAVGRVDAVPTILDVVCKTTGMGFAAIARVTEDRWIACSVRDEINFGLKPGGELDVKTTICDEIRVSTTPVIIDDVSTDPLYCGHPTAAKYGFRSYISMPIFKADRSFFGTLCAIDPEPAQVSRPEVIGMFRLFADLIGFHLDAEDRLRQSEKTILDHEQLHRLRDQFIAVLGHDLRNPLAAIDAGARLLGKADLDDKSKKLLGYISQSVDRMAELINNVLDLARGRLGGGMTVNKTTDTDLRPVLEHVIAEIRSANPERPIHSEIDVTVPVFCDASRLGQMLSNLVGNALTHGQQDGKVRVRARTLDGRFELMVANQGEPIPASVAANLFEPFSRATDGSKHEGLGLGLYICAEIARAHGGQIDLTTDATETRFTFSMPNGR